jgi:hypothetical protein
MKPTACLQADCQKVALSESAQRAVLVTGMELSLYMSHRLEVYLNIYARVLPSLASANFRKALVDVYGHILRFLAKAIRRRGSASIAKALWGSDDLMQFEERCDVLCIRAAEEARLCASEISEQWRVNLDTRLSSLDEIHHLRASLTRLHDKADLAKLVSAREATYDSSAEGGLPRCLPGTRIELLGRINTWTVDPLGKRIFWLCGKAGIGKSTISRTVAETLDKDGRLGASFFFKRGRADRSHAKLFFPTIAKQLADKIPDLGHAIAAALEEDSLLCEKHMTKQFDKLLLQPLQSNLTIQPLLGDCFLVIDALDECEDTEQVETLLELLKRIENVTSSRIRILITSRPDPPLIAGFKAMSSSLLQDVHLEEAQVESIRSDLEIFLNHELVQIGTRYPRLNPFGSLPTDWAKPSDIKLLVNKSHPLFIIAFTICKILSSSNEPQEDLRQIVLQKNGNGVSTGLAAVYLPILQQAVATTSKGGTKESLPLFRKIIGSLILLYDPLSVTSLSRLLVRSIREVGTFIPPLRSVLNLPERVDGTLDPLGAIKPFHLSFRDFLVDPDLAADDEGKKFWIDEAQAHKQLAGHCLRLLRGGTLMEDVCRTNAPGTRRAAINQAVIAKNLPEEVAYACSYWVQHIVTSGERLEDDDDVHRFLRNHLLHWIEALSWLGKASDVIHSLGSLRAIVDVSQAQMHDLSTVD